MLGRRNGARTSSRAVGRGRGRISVGALASAGAAAAIMLGAVAAHAGRRGVLEAMLALPATHRSGWVFVELQTGEDPGRFGVPRLLVDRPVATIRVARGGRRLMQLALTRAIRAAAARTGFADFDFFAYMGNREAVSTASLAVPAPGRGALAYASSAPALPQITFGRWSTVAASRPGARAQDASPPPQGGQTLPTGTTPAPTGSASPGSTSVPQSPVPPPCYWTASGGLTEQEARLGQMQDSSEDGAYATWIYDTEADSTFGVGFSAQPNANYYESGSASVTNSIGAEGGFTVHQGFNRYVDGHVYRQSYYSNINPNNGQPACGARYRTEIVRAVGDSYPGPNSPPLDPYGRCGNDPYGLAKMVPGGYYDADRGHAVTYSAAASFFGLSVSGSTGYTNDIHIKLGNASPVYMYACGSGYLPYAPVLWSNSIYGN